MRDGFLVKIIPAGGYSVYRLHVSRAAVAAVLAAFVVLLVAAVGVHALQLRAAAADIARLEAQRIEQQRRLDAMEAQTTTLQQQNAASRRAIEAIRHALGTSAAGHEHAVLPPRLRAASALPERLAQLERAAAQTSADAERLRGLARHVLNVRRLASIARERMIAAIPSFSPAGGAISATFGYRTVPFPEFHKGVDIAAEYGTAVRAAADGTVVAAGWDGGCGIKIDLDHGNGYHTWYCHLSRADVASGRHVNRGQVIGAVGSTGESTGPHLHYAVMREGVAVDPLPYLHGVPANVLATLPDVPGVQ